MGLVPLQHRYPDLEDFFVNTMGVKAVTAEMVLMKLVGEKLSFNERRDIVLQLGTLIDKYGSNIPVTLSPELLSGYVLPIRGPRGKSRGGKAARFLIADCDTLSEYFKDEISLLAFDVKEVASLKRFITWAGLEDKYLSKAAKTVLHPDPKTLRPISSPIHKMMRKTQAIFR